MFEVVSFFLFGCAVSFLSPYDSWRIYQLLLIAVLLCVVSGLKYIPQPSRWSEFLPLAIGVIPALVSLRWVATLIDESFFLSFDIPYSEVSSSDFRQVMLVSYPLMITALITLLVLGLIGWACFFIESVWDSEYQKNIFICGIVVVFLIISFLTLLQLGIDRSSERADSIKHAAQRREEPPMADTDFGIMPLRPVCLKPLNPTKSDTSYFGNEIPKGTVLLATTRGDWIWIWIWAWSPPLMPEEEANISASKATPRSGGTFSAKKENCIIEPSEWAARSC